MSGCRPPVLHYSGQALPDFFEISSLWRGVYAEKVAWTVSTAENKLAKGVVKLKADQLTSLKVCCRGFLPSSEPWNKC